MNMISTGAFLNEMDASSKQPTRAEKFAAVWEKKNAKAARAGGVSLMALSLAACGSSSTTTTTTDTTTDTTTTTPVVVAGKSLVLTSANDVIAATAAEAKAQSGAGDDTLYGMTDGLLTSGDVIDGGDGSDTIEARVTANDQTIKPTLTSVENVNIEITAANTKDVTIDVTSTDKAVTSVTLTTVDAAANADDTEVVLKGVQTSDAVALDFSGMTTGTLTNATVTYDTVTGTADSASVTLKGKVTDTDIAGIETLSATVEKFTGSITAAAATEVTITAGATSTNTSTVTDVTQATAVLKTLNLAGSGETLDVNNADIDFKGDAVVNITNTGSTLVAIANLAAATNSLSVTGGAGKDNVDIDQVAQGTITVNTNGGDDTVTIDGGVVTVNTGDGDDNLVVTTWSSVAATDAIDLGAGTDTVTTSEATLGASQKTVGGYYKNAEIFESTATTLVTIDTKAFGVADQFKVSGAMAAVDNGTKDTAGTDSVALTTENGDSFTVSAARVGQTGGDAGNTATAAGKVGGDGIQITPKTDGAADAVSLTFIGNADVSGGTGEAGGGNGNGGDGGDALIASSHESVTITLLGTQVAGGTADTVTFTGGTGGAAGGNGAAGANGDSVTVGTNATITLASGLDPATAKAAVHNHIDLGTVKGTNVTVDGADFLGKITATAGDGNVTLKGGAAIDNLTGGSGSDTISGGAGADVLDGNGGVDTFTSGAGIDTIKIASTDAGTTGTEKVTDFATGLTSGDKLDLADTQLIADATGTNVAAAITSGAVGDTLTANVSKGVITLAGNATAKIDTAAELKAIFELLDINNDVEVGAIEMGGNTYVLVDAASGNGGTADSVADILMLEGVTGITAVATTAADNTIFIA